MIIVDQYNFDAYDYSNGNEDSRSNGDSNSNRDRGGLFKDCLSLSHSHSVFESILTSL